jgi:IclR family KDG regulon transcriptional repressor
MESKSFNASVVKSFKILELFTSERHTWGVRELAMELKANKSTTYRLMATLCDLDILKKNEDTEKYSLGLKLFELGNRVNLNQSIISKTHPTLELVAEKITETVHLGILNNNEVVMIDKVESPKGLKLNSLIGASSPAYCTGLGKVLLSELNEDELNKYLKTTDFKAFTKNTIISKAILKTALKIILDSGFALDKEEKEIGLICLAVPIYNKNGAIFGALSAAGPSTRFDERKLKDYLKILRQGARDIGKSIGVIDSSKI